MGKIVTIRLTIAFQRTTGAIAGTGAAMALVGIIEALVLIFGPHQYPPGWTPFDFDVPVETASLVVTVPVMISP